MSDTRELDAVFDELPPNVQQELQALEEIVYQQKRRIAELEQQLAKNCAHMKFNMKFMEETMNETGELLDNSVEQLAKNCAHMKFNMKFMEETMNETGELLDNSVEQLAELREAAKEYMSVATTTNAPVMKRLAALKCDMIKRERYHKAELKTAQSFSHYVVIERDNLRTENVRLRNRLKMEMSWHSAGGNFDRVTAIKEVLEVKRAGGYQAI